MLIGKRAASAAIGAVGLLLMSACTYPGPNPPEFGYNTTGSGDIVIAYPLCPGYTVSGASVYVRADSDGGNFDFRTLWQAVGPASKAAESGLFTVGTSASFQTVKLPLKGDLPNGFYVEVGETFQGREADGRDGWIDLKHLTSAHLKSGEFMTSKGKVMTRDQISAQLTCSSTSSTG
ncbi:hypothetical protein ACIPC1_16385 [Streptomyces sp. NPDC087263]|uniref:hypothetical protein n=1 Tax=Streptomyces sp. NPDC087263 TaxID=3365773 RepID=UPI003810ACE4